jgi:hypothetical protein
MTEQSREWNQASPIGGAPSGSPAHRAAQRRANQTILIGALLLVIGIAISVGTYAYAASNPRGGHYLLAWGPIVFGLIVLIRGLRSRSRIG